MFSKIFCGNKKIFLIFAVLFLNLLFVSPALAAVSNSTDYVPLVSIPGVNPSAGLLTYLSGLYNFLISVVGILAMAVIIYGGMRYLTSAGNPSSVEEAKDAITSAVTGLILALVSWLILSTINPDILVLKSVGVSGAGTYSYMDAQNTCVANATGTGTAANPCICIDGAKTYMAAGAKKGVTLSLSSEVSSYPTGSSTVLRGKLVNSSSGWGINGKQITINLINDSLNGMRNDLTGNTDILGDYLISDGKPAACGGTIRVVASFAGDADYLPATSSPITLNITGTPACTAANFPDPIKDLSASGGSACQSICSDPKLSYDNAFHCLVARIRAVAAKGLSYDDQKLYAREYNTDDDPLIITDGAWVNWDGIHYSSFYYTPVKACIDGLANPALLNGTCDQPTELGGIGGTNIRYADYAGNSLCTNITNPAAIQCKFLYMLQDAKGYSANDTYLYIRILKP